MDTYTLIDILKKNLIEDSKSDANNAYFAQALMSTIEELDNLKKYY